MWFFFRDDSDSDSERERVKRKEKKRRASSGSESGGDQMEKERLRDLKERDEFADRLKIRDQEKQKNIANPSGNS